MWVLSSGRPESGLAGLRCEPMAGVPTGIYLAPPLLRLGIVAIRELPETRETLLLRLMGAGPTLKRAIAALKALPEDAPERAIALPILLRLRLDAPKDPAKQTREDQEFLMTTQDVVELWKQEVRNEGIEEGSLREARSALRRVLAKRKLGLSAADEARIDTCADLATLERWLEQAIDASSAAEALR